MDGLQLKGGISCFRYELTVDTGDFGVSNRKHMSNTAYNLGDSNAKRNYH